MTVCGAVGALMVGGRVVGQVRCELAAGHDSPTVLPLPWRPTPAIMPGTPHRMTLTWTPEAEPDLDLFDPDEKFDAEVPFGPCTMVHDFGGLGDRRTRDTCRTCGTSYEEWRATKSRDD